MRRSAGGIGSRVILRLVCATRGGDFYSHVPQRRLASLPVVLYVQHHPHVLAELPADDEGYQELQGLQCLTAPADEQAGVLAGQIDYRPTRLGVVGGAQRTGDIDPGSFEDAAHRRAGHGSRRRALCRSARAATGGYKGYADSGQFGPDAQEARLAPT